MPKTVTLYDLEASIVNIDVPHGDLLVTIAAALGRWQAEVQRLNASMDALRARGLYLDPDNQPVVPGWSERKANGRHVAWYLIWPRSYARATGHPRRQYIRAAQVEATRVKVKRTLEYANLAAWRDRVIERRKQVGQDLDKLIKNRGLAPVTPAWRTDQDDAQPDNEMVPNLAAPGSVLVPTASSRGPGSVGP